MMILLKMMVPIAKMNTQIKYDIIIQTQSMAGNRIRSHVSKISGLQRSMDNFFVSKITGK